MEGARSRSLRLDVVPEEAEPERKESKLTRVSEWLTKRPVTAPERVKCDVSVLFSIKQLTGRAVTWEGLRHALASLGRPSTLSEVADTMWTMYRVYCNTLELGLDLEQVPRSDKFLAGVQHLVERHAEAGQLHTAVVGPETGEGEKVYIWLGAEEWPDTREREAWLRYRTVHQAVRCAIQDMVDRGERYNGVFAQVKRIHDFVQEHTNFTKKQVREVISEIQQSLQKVIPAQPKTVKKSQSLGFLSTKTLPWNYGVGAEKKEVCSNSMRSKNSKQLHEHLKEKEFRRSLIDINELSKLLTNSSRHITHNYLD